MPQFLYRVRPARIAMLAAGPTQREARVIGEHLAYLEQLVAGGTVLMAGRTQTTDERTFGIVLLEAESEDAAARIMREDPAVAQGVMHAELFPYRVALWSAKGPSRNAPSG